MRRAVALAVVVGWTAGCGGANDGRLQITGKVTLDGQPIPGGYVRLSPLGSGPSAGGRIEQGEFTIARDKGPMAGKYRVVIEAMRETGRMVPVDPALPDDLVADTEQYIPAHYNTRSQLTIELSPDNTHFEFKLSSDVP